MKRRASTIAAALLAAASLQAQEDLPRHAPGEPLDFEPKLMLDGPHAAAAAPPSPTPAPTPLAPEEMVRQKEAALLNARKRVAESERLYQEGILAKVEVEARALQVVQIRKELADARLAAAALHAEAERKSYVAQKASQADFAAATAALDAARTAAMDAAAAWDQAQLDAATNDLNRKRKLFAEGACSKREVEMAEDRVALLSGTAGK